MSKRKITVYVNEDIFKIHENKAFEMEAGIFEIPFFTEKIKCECDTNCYILYKDYIKELTEVLRKRFKGDSHNPGFPFWNSYYENLINLEEFDIKDYVQVPDVVPYKIIFSIQFILNKHTSENWDNEIIEYLRWIISSFGSFPAHCGRPLYLMAYIHQVKNLLSNHSEIPNEKISKIHDYLEIYLNPTIRPKTDLIVLKKTYDRWLKIFPFELNSYFGELKTHFENILPIINGKPVINKYSGMSEVNIFTKSSLFEYLITLTNYLLIQVNGISLYEKGLISDVDKIKMELIINDRKQELKYGYKNDSKNEDLRYRRMIKKWFQDEKRFIDEIKPLIKNDSLSIKKKNDKKEIELLKRPLSHSYIALICFYQGISVSNRNGKSVLDKFGGVGLPKKLIEKYKQYLIRDYRIYGPGSRNENSNRLDLARQKLFIEVIKYLQLNDLNSSEAEKDLIELQKYL